MTEYSSVKPQPKEAVKPESKEVSERPKMKQIAKKPIKKRKRGVVERLVVGLLGPDGLPKISKYLGSEVIMPALKETLVNAIKSGIDMAVYGSDSAPKQQHYTGGTSYSRPYQATAYRPTTSYSHPQGPAPTGGYGTPAQNAQMVERTRIGNFNSQDYLIPERGVAMEILQGMREQLYDYGTVTLADFYDAIAVENTYADNNYGWTDLEHARVMSVRGGYSLNLPDLEVLK